MFNLSYLTGGRLDSPFMPTKTQPFIKGQMLSVPSGFNTHTLVYTPDQDMELMSVAVGANSYQRLDYWDLFVGEEVICESIYTKDVPEGVYLMVALPILTGTQIVFRFHNESGSAKSVWVNYQFLR